MEKERERVLTDEQIKEGMKRLEDWFVNKPDNMKDEYIVLGGTEEHCWTPRKIVETMRERVKNDDWGHRDIPEESFITLATKSK